jgi:WD40 repeat protein
MAVSADGKILVGQVSGGAGQLQIWDLDKRKRLHAFKNPDGTTLPVALSPDAKVAAYATMNRWNNIVLRDVATGKELRQLSKKDRPLSDAFRGLAFSSDGGLIIVGSDNEILGWDPRSGEPRFSWKVDGKIFAMSEPFHDGKHVACGFEKGRVAIWDITTGKPALTLPAKDDFNVEAITVSRDGSLIATVGLETIIV